MKLLIINFRQKKNRIFFYIFFLLTQFTFAQSQKVTVEDVFRRYLLTGEKSMAEMVINSNDSLYSLFCKATLTNDETEAIDLYSKFILLNPKYGLAEAYLYRGIKYNSLDSAELSIADLDKSIEYNDKEPYAYYFRGSSYKMLNQYEKSIEDFSKAIKLNPTFDLAYFMRGNSYFSKKDYDKAILDYSKTLTLDKKSEQAYIMRCLVYEAINEYKKAIADWNEVIKMKSYDNTERAKKFIERVSEKMKN